MPKSNPPVDHGEELVVIPRGTIQKLKFTWTRLKVNSPSFFNIRQWHRGDDDQWYPTPKRGIGIHVNELPALFEAVILAAEKALAKGAGNGDPELSIALRAIMDTSRSNGVPAQLAKKTQLATVSHQELDTIHSVRLEGWSVRQDKKGFYRAYRRINGKVRSVYLGKTLVGADEKVQAANERWS